MSEIVTERLRLRRARAADLAAFHAMLSHPLAMRYWSSPAHRELQQTREWLASMIAAPPELSDDYVVEFEGLVIGKAGCWRLPEVGYIFHPAAWGHGFATEALRAVIAHVFATRTAPELTADVDPRNEASLRLLARLGFVEIGGAKRTWLIGEEWCDSVYLALRRPDD